MQQIVSTNIPLEKTLPHGSQTVFNILHCKSPLCQSEFTKSHFMGVKNDMTQVCNSL